MPSKEFHIHSKEVHTAPFTLGCTGGFSIKFSHTGVGTDSFGKRKAMITITGNERIIGPGCSHTTGSNSFLADISMKESADLSFHLILFFGHHFKLPDQLHEFIPV